MTVRFFLIVAFMLMSIVLNVRANGQMGKIEYVKFTNIVNGGNTITRYFIFNDSAVLKEFKHEYSENPIIDIVITKDNYDKLVNYILNVKQEVILTSRNDLYISIMGKSEIIDKKRITIYVDSEEGRYIFDIIMPDRYDEE